MRPLAAQISSASTRCVAVGFYAVATLRQQELLIRNSFMQKKSGRGPPTAPTLRPRVLTPRDHFVHRGGERSGIMQ